MSTRVLIRAYRETDLEAIISIWKSASAIAHDFLSETYLKGEEKSIREVYMLSAETHVILLDNELVGFISMIGNEIGALFVHPRFQGLGLGKRLVDFVREITPRLTVKVFEKNEMGRGFYARQGFASSGKEFHEKSGEILLLLTLSPMHESA